MLWTKKLMIMILISLNLCGVAVGNEDYDPQHTMLALNMAIVSVHKIVTTEDRIVLDQEYQNIINNLKLGNIEEDVELQDLYLELMDTITRKTLSGEERVRFQYRYNAKEQRALVSSLANRRPSYGGNLWSFLGSVAMSGVSAYFGYQNSKTELLENLDDELWLLRRDQIEAINTLQKNLLSSSWNLLRQYNLPDAYLLTQGNMADFDKATQETDSKKSVRMFRTLEPQFKVYPPFWYFYGKAALQNGDIKLARQCFTEFETVWRPVLRQDPYRLEVAKYRTMDLVNNKAPNDEILEQLKIIRENTPRFDWNNNLFAGVMYFVAGEIKQGMDCLQINIVFGHEIEISKKILQSMQEGKFDYVDELLQKELELAFKAALKRSEEQVKKYDDEALNKLNKEAEEFYRNGDIQKAEDLFLKAANQGNTAAQFNLGVMFWSGDIEQNNIKAVEWFKKAAELGNVDSQVFLSEMYREGRGVQQDYVQAMRWARKAADAKDLRGLTNLGIMYKYGLGGEQNDARALELFREAAEHDFSYAQYYLGTMYEGGRGVAENLEEAYMWYYISSSNGLIYAKKKIEELEGSGVIKSLMFWRGLSKKQIQNAQIRALNKKKDIENVKNLKIINNDN
jgi:TPR repeat protein